MMSRAHGWSGRWVWGAGFLILSSLTLCAGPAYQSVMQELTRHENRLVGGVGYQASVTRLEQTLREAGLAPHRQTFGTLVPETRECRLTVDGVALTPVYALGPNGVANNTTAGKVLRGPLVWLGNGSLDEMKGKPVGGAIAVLNFDSPNMMQVLSQGALAILFVGTGRETQWEVRKQFFEMDASVPRLFVKEATAREHGLLDGAARRQAEVAITTIWKEETGINLWVEIPASNGVAAAAETKEALVLSATYDTFGVIPETTPAIREAANCALLAEVAVALSQRPLARSVYVVFFGSHYAMQEGARMFYFALQQGGKGELENRGVQYVKAAEEARAREAVLAADDLFAPPVSEALPEVLRALEKRLGGKVSTMNFELQTARLAQKKLRQRAALMPGEDRILADLVATETRLSTHRKSLNGLRKQLMDRKVTDLDALRPVLAEERVAVQREIEQFRALGAHNATDRELYARVGAKRLTGHYAFDFANAHDDWMLNMSGAGAQMFYHSLNLKAAEIRIGDYVKNIRALAGIEAALPREDTASARLFVEPTLALLDPERFCVPSVRSVPARVAQAMQVFGYQMMTVGDPLNRDEMPYRQTVDLEPLGSRMTAFCEQLATAAPLSQVCPLAKPLPNQETVINFSGSGGRYLYYARGSTEVAGVPENAMTACTPQGGNKSPYLAGNSYSSFAAILPSGHIFMPMMYEQVPLRPLGFDANGAFDRFPAVAKWNNTRLFYGFGGLVNAALRPGGFSAISGSIVRGDTDSAHKTMYSRPADQMMTFYGEKDAPFKMYAKDGLMILGSTKENPRGKGIPLADPPLYALNTLQQAAHDYLLLNESRLQVLREKSIVNDSLESLQADARQHWEDAVVCRASQDVARAVAHEAFAAGIGVRVSSPLRDVTNDMVRAVVLLLLLLLPFAFVMERLMISAVSIYHQVVGFAGFFVSFFVLLYLVHPAFAIASSPLIIFLAFIIILLSTVVIVIVMSKFKKELRAIQGLSTSAHGVAADSSTAMAAVLIGISGMRNRPLKTFLTALTIILLTFAIVVFASFSPMIGVTETYLGKGTDSNRIELHRFSGLGMPRMLHESLAALYSGQWHTFAREAIFRAPQSTVTGDLVAYRAANHKWESLQAMVAIDPRELAFNASLSNAIPGLADWASSATGRVERARGLPPIFLAERAAQSLELSPGDPVTLGGKAFAFAGVFDAAALDRLQFMDGSKLMPPDFESSEKEVASTGEESKQKLAEDAFVDTSRFTYCPARSVAITLPGELAELEREQLSVQVNAITLYASETADVNRTAVEIAKIFEGPVMAKGATGASQFFFSRSMQAAGFAVLIVPLLLGGLIIFNSLLGSIVERRKEIFTYSAMGLAPPDVGALFFAESAVYAILGGMGGYLVSQVVAKGVNLCGQLGWFVPPEMNFSSLASVLTIFVVMGMVMVSTIYPALKAGRSANPGVARKWRMPAAVNDEIEFVFPFTVSANDMGGILAFIAEHFENHGDASIGSFAATGVALFKEKGSGNLGIRANVTLAPFDLGVMQAFTISARPSEIEEIDEVVVRLKRVSGSAGAWLRGNRVFVDDLREQFLFWRSLPVATVSHYREQSASAIREMA